MGINKTWTHGWSVCTSNILQDETDYDRLSNWNEHENNLRSFVLILKRCAFLWYYFSYLKR